MDKDLTVFIMPGQGNCNIKRAALSVDHLAYRTVLLNGRASLNQATSVKSCLVKTSWWLFLFSDEWLSEPLQKAVSYLVEENIHDAYVFMRKGRGHSQCFRMFKKGILIDDNFNPSNLNGISYERILDGFIMGDE